MRNLIRERTLVRSLPWSYISHRARRSPVIMVQLLALPAIALGLPLGFALNLGGLLAVCWVLWLAALAAPLVRSVVRRVAGRR